MTINQRRCLSCRRLANKEKFWRIVRVHSSHQVQLDNGMGRSAYLCPCVDCLQLAQRKNRLGRSLRIRIPDTVYAQLWQRLSQTEPEASKDPENSRSKQNSRQSSSGS